MKHAVIFDIDGTLWDSRALVAEGYNLQLRREGLEHLCVTAEDFLPLFGKVMTQIADVIFATVAVPERYALMERCMDTENRYLAQHPCPIGYPGVRQTLTELAKHRRLFIVSNSQKGYPELCIRKLGLEGLVEGHLCFGDTGTDKGTTIRRLMEKYSLSGGIYVGDTQLDADAAADAGIPFVWAAYGFGQPKHFHARVDRFDQLPAVLEGMP